MFTGRHGRAPARTTSARRGPLSPRPRRSRPYFPASTVSHQARCSRYQATVERIPSSNRCAGRQPSSVDEPGRIDGVPAIVARAVGDERARGPRSAVTPRAASAGFSAAGRIASSAAQIPSTISRFVRSSPAAHVVPTAGHARPQHEEQRRAVVLDVEPVPHVAAVAVERQRSALDRVERHEGDQLLRILEGPVVVRAVRDAASGAGTSRDTPARGDRRPPSTRRTASSGRTGSPRRSVPSARGSRTPRRWRRAGTGSGPGARARASRGAGAPRPGARRCRRGSSRRMRAGRRSSGRRGSRPPGSRRRPGRCCRSRPATSARSAMSPWTNAERGVRPDVARGSRGCPHR